MLVHRVARVALDLDRLVIAMHAVIERYLSPTRFAMILAATLLLGASSSYIIGTAIASHATHPGSYRTVVELVQGREPANPSTISGPTEPRPIDGLTP